MKALTDRHDSVLNCQQKCLCHVLNVHMIQCLHSEVGNSNLIASPQCSEYRGIEIPEWVDRRPSWAPQVSWMKNSDWKTRSINFVHEQRLNRGLADSIVTEWRARSIFSCGY